ncbi:type II toxin-antitoxin system RelE/ParE family toxin [Yersinia bercovieri]|uniref:type II toxin-antitoxin system RelE/ParE family toxin n=1 Tax=Yersinia bercovieri TaxID=634 RepID=UPI00119EEE5F|nr:type II toxin-antitoxin system RelE/ParE family toxin [Yersinia bercovieri]
MITTYRLTPDARTDLIEIRRYTVKQWGLAQSQKYIAELRRTIHLLTVNPYLGKHRLDVGLDVLSFPHASHVIYYLLHEQQLIVFGVLHKHRVPLNHLADRTVT